MIVVGWLMLAGSVQANDLAPVALQSVTPDRSWFYNLEEVVFDADESYVPNGYIAWTKWYIDGVYQTQGSYYHNMSVCFALYGSPEGDCYELDQGQTTVQIKLMVQSNYGYWDEQTITYTIKEHKGRKYFVKDHLGSVRTTVNRDGNVLGYDDYYPFGLSMPGRSSNSANPNDDYKFTGYEEDDEAGLTLYHAGARGYDPVLGRFLQIDPMSHLYPGLSSYNYAFNNPLSWTDPTGKDPCDTDGDGVNDSWCMDEIEVTAQREPSTESMLNIPELSEYGMDETCDPEAKGISPVAQVQAPTAQPQQSQQTQPEMDTEFDYEKLLSCLGECSADQLGVTDALALAGALSGQPILPTRGKFMGSVRGTSPASRAANIVFGDLKSPVRLPTITGGIGTGRRLGLKFTKSVARFSGRAVPVIGWAMLGWDAYKIGDCTYKCMNEE